MSDWKDTLWSAFAEELEKISAIKPKPFKVKAPNTTPVSIQTPAAQRNIPPPSPVLPPTQKPVVNVNTTGQNMTLPRPTPPAPTLNQGSTGAMSPSTLPSRM